MFSKWPQSEWSCHISSNFYVTEIGVCRSLPIIIIVLMPTWCSLKLGTVVTALILSFNYFLFVFSWMAENLHRHIKLILVSDHINSSMVELTVEFVSLSVLGSHFWCVILCLSSLDRLKGVKRGPIIADKKSSSLWLHTNFKINTHADMCSSHIYSCKHSVLHATLHLLPWMQVTSVP